MSLSQRNFEKNYTREGTLVTLEIWEGQYTTLKDKIGISEFIPFSVYHSHNDIIDTYFDTEIVNEWLQQTGVKAENDSAFTNREMLEFEENLGKLQVIWSKGYVDTREEFKEFFDLAAKTWASLSISYVLPTKENVAKEDRDLALQLRDRSQNFLDDTDRVVEATLRKEYPQQGDLIKYISSKEYIENSIPSQEELEKRKKEYIYFGFTLYTDVSLQEFALQKSINFKVDVIPENVSEIKGQIAMKGVVKGKVRILRKKAEIALLEEGEILVTAMTTPEYLPAMHKAAAFVTDEGGITCHAAIVARELKKPCIIGTKIATKVLKDGDMVEVDADNGIVKNNQMSNLIEEIKEYTFTLRSQYPNLPVIYFEPATYKYVDNPYLEKTQPGLIFAIDTGLDAWIDEDKKPIVSSSEKIKQIVDDCLSYKANFEEYIRTIDSRDIATEEFIEEFCNKVTELYKTYTFFADECFETTDEQLLENLPKIRVEVSEFVIQKLFPIFDEIIKQVSDKTRISSKVLARATINEFKEILDNRQVTISEDRPLVMVGVHNKVEYIKDREGCNEFIEYLHSKNKIETVVTEIKGRSAQKGKVTGRVIVLQAVDYLHAEKILGGHKDYILVTPMTRPEILPYMKEAAAFVTDEGGITCHAAIVARELKKPCVIGTKIATQVLHDGDMVEVDAEKGLITILNN